MSNQIEKAKIIEISKLLSLNNLVIPDYQRPYKWTIKNVNQLIDDILFFKDKKSYRLGTIVLYKETKEGKDSLNIVDGQQRTTTLFLLFLAIQKQKEELLKKHKDRGIFIQSKLQFDSKISI